MLVGWDLEVSGNKLDGGREGGMEVEELEDKMKKY